MNLDPKNLIFSDIKFEFTSGYRFLWRVVYISFYIIFIIATILFVTSGINWARWAGVLFILFLLDRIKHLGQGNISVLEIKPNLLGGINCADYFSAKTSKILENAIDKTSFFGGNLYLHVLKQLIRRKDVRGVLWRMEISPEEFEQKVDEQITAVGAVKSLTRRDILEQAILLGKYAFIESYLNKSRFVDPSDIFAALGRIDDSNLKKLLYLFSIETDDLEKATIFSKYRMKFSGVGRFLFRTPDAIGKMVFKSQLSKHKVVNRAWTSRPTPVLDQFSTDLTDLARSADLGLLIGHEKEYENLVSVLSRSEKPNAILVGEPGSGKEAIMGHLAFNIIKDKVPEPLFDKRLVALNVQALVSGVNSQEVNTRLNIILDEIVAAKNIVIYIPEIHSLMKTSGTELNGLDILLPAVRANRFQVVGAAYLAEFKNLSQEREDLFDAFEKVLVEEISEDDATTILTYESILLEQEYKLTVTFEAIKQSVVLAHKYLRQQLLPSSAEELLKESFSFAKQRGDKILNHEAVIAVCERKVNVPIHQSGAEESARLLNLESIIHEQMIDQEQAVKAVAEALRQYRSGLNRNNGPIATFLFVGPTGVGKTELAKILAKTQFGSEDLMIRFDMSEYQDKQSIFRFIGSPDGKVIGNLTERVLDKPYCLILLDEFEKAHPDVLNIFLQIFDDGRVTDNTGKVVDFKNTIIIATSNANSEFIKEQIETGKNVEEFKDEFKKKLTAFFKPELLNRFSDLVIFKNLSKDDILQITKLQLKSLAKTVNENQGIDLEFSDEVITYVCDKGFDPVFGARPLRGVISNEIKSKLAEKILKKELIRGSRIKLVLDEGELDFENM